MNDKHPNLTLSSRFFFKKLISFQVNDPHINLVAKLSSEELREKRNVPIFA